MNRITALALPIATAMTIGLIVQQCPAATYGNTTPFNRSSGHRPDVVIGVRVNIPEELILDSFGLMHGHPDWTTLGPSDAVFGLYDSSGAGGLPGALVAQTDNVNVSGIATYTFDFNSHPTIAPGAYWMMGLYENWASPRSEYPNSPDSYVHFAQPFEAGLPVVAPTSGVIGGESLNYWINGTSVPEPASVCLFVVFALILHACNRMPRMKKPPEGGWCLNHPRHHPGRRLADWPCPQPA